MPMCQRQSTCQLVPMMPPGALRALDASMLKLSGTGHWDLPFLSPDLAMAHAEPKSLLIDWVPDPSEYPKPD